MILEMGLQLHLPNHLCKAQEVTAREAKAALLFLKQKRIFKVPSSLPQRMGIAHYGLVISIRICDPSANFNLEVGV